MLTYPFTEADARQAYDDWGCNCGPASLAFVLQVPLESVRHAIPDFDSKRYTSPTMMRSGLKAMGRTVTAYGAEDGPTKATMFGRNASLVRIQWCGPWTQPGTNPKWAYWHTHWIVTWLERNEVEPIGGMKTTQAQLWVFDVNGGIQSFNLWESTVVPAITSSINRADGEWFPTHVWRLDQHAARPQE